MADGTMAMAATPGGLGPSSGRASAMQRFTRRRSTIGFLMCLPLILLIATLVVYPAFYALWLAMLNKKMTTFVGLGNFAFLLKRNTFQLVVFQSTLFAVTSVILKALIGFIL
ncbi:MAG: sugar ABC transporter permease, partial [Rhodospirillales bacterium]|nr:sugar ABC transporter permease [Rhodospirillales bacterium]